MTLRLQVVEPRRVLARITREALERSRNAFHLDSTSAWILSLVVGLAAIFLGLTTKHSGGYRRAEHPATS
jgi:hypothetical protein